MIDSTDVNKQMSIVYSSFTFQAASTSAVVKAEPVKKAARKKTAAAAKRSQPGRRSKTGQSLADQQKVVPSAPAVTPRPRNGRPKKKATPVTKPATTPKITAGTVPTPGSSRRNSFGRASPCLSGIAMNPGLFLRVEPLKETNSDPRPKKIFSSRPSYAVGGRRSVTMAGLGFGVGSKHGHGPVVQLRRSPRKKAGQPEKNASMGDIDKSLDKPAVEVGDLFEASPKKSVPPLKKTTSLKRRLMLGAGQANEDASCSSTSLDTQNQVAERQPAKRIKRSPVKKTATKEADEPQSVSSPFMAYEGEDGASDHSKLAQDEVADVLMDFDMPGGTLEDPVVPRIASPVPVRPVSTGFDCELPDRFLATPSPTPSPEKKASSTAASQAEKRIDEFANRPPKRNVRKSPRKAQPSSEAAENLEQQPPGAAISPKRSGRSKKAAKNVATDSHGSDSVQTSGGNLDTDTDVRSPLRQSNADVDSDFDLFADSPDQDEPGEFPFAYCNIYCDGITCFSFFCFCLE